MIGVISTAVNLDTVSLVINYDTYPAFPYRECVRCAIHMDKVGTAVSFFRDQDAMVRAIMEEECGIHMYELPKNIKEV